MNILKWQGLDIDPMKINESVTTKPVIGQVDTAFNEHTNESGVVVLYPKIEAIHAGRTRNFNRYLAEKLQGDPSLRSGVYSWTAPYPKPVIHNHDISTEATGRVYSATFSEITQAGRPGIIVTPKITQEKAIKDILEGRLLTVSIGASTDAAVCSICGTDIINEGFCGHMRGEEYDGETAEWIAGNLWFDELSWVNVPADQDAMITNNSMSPGAVPEQPHSQENAEPIVITEKEEDNDSSITLTTDSEVVKSVSESTEKEEGNVTEDTNVVAESTEESTEVVEDNATNEETAQVVENEVEESAETVEEEAPAEVTEQEEAEEQEAEKVEESSDDQSNLAEELAKAKSDLADSQKTVEELKAANVALAKELSETVAGFLVDLRVATGKEADREKAVEKFRGRSIESLRDSISDILDEKPEIQPSSRTVEKVEMPKGDVVDVTESTTLASGDQMVTSNEDALYSLLTGRRK